MLFSFLWQLSTQGAKRELLLTDRPYLPMNIQALEGLFEDNDNDLKVLNLLLQELQHVDLRAGLTLLLQPGNDPHQATRIRTFSTI
jgi:hypothetical protein